MQASISDDSLSPMQTPLTVQQPACPCMQRYHPQTLPARSRLWFPNLTTPLTWTTRLFRLALLHPSLFPPFLPPPSFLLPPLFLLPSLSSIHFSLTLITFTTLVLPRPHKETLCTVSVCGCVLWWLVCVCELSTVPRASTWQNPLGHSGATWAKPHTAAWQLSEHNHLNATMATIMPMVSVGGGLTRSNVYAVTHGADHQINC